MSTITRVARRAIKSVVGGSIRAIGPEDPRLSLSNWDLTARPRVGLCQAGCSLHELAARWGSPLHVVHAPTLRANAAEFQRTTSPSGRSCEVFFSYKTNPVPGVLRMLHSAGVGAEVISPYEFWLARKLGVSADQIVYNGPAQSEASIREAFAAGVRLLNINHHSEIGKVARVASQLGVRGRVGLRISLDEGWSGQFGTPVRSGEAISAYREALAQPSLEVVAIHAHRGVTIRTESELASFVQSVLDFVDAAHHELGFEPEILDFGGSLSIPTVQHLSSSDLTLNRMFGRAIVPPDPSKALHIGRYVELLVTLVESHYAKQSRPCPRIYLEPGRAMTGNSQLLVSTVLNIKETPDRIFAIMDAGINLADDVRSSYHQTFPVNRFGHPVSRRYVWTGPICSPGDVLYQSLAMPSLAIGDTLAIMDTGAYFVPFATSFSFPQPAIVVIDAGEDHLIRRAESYEDLVQADVTLGDC